MSEIGEPANRIDGLLKVTGAARYTTEHKIPNLVHAVLITGTIACGRITRLDARGALRSPGVISVITHLNMPKLAAPEFGFNGQGLPILGDEKIYYYGQTIGVVVAETLEQATHAATLVQVSYAADSPISAMSAALAAGRGIRREGTREDVAFIPPKGWLGRRSADSVRGDAERAFGKAATRLDETYETQLAHHNAMEPHAAIAEWTGENLTLYVTTQGVHLVREVLAKLLAMPKERVRVVCQFIGGGFGSKGPIWAFMPLAAIAARTVNRPVKLVLTRRQMYYSNGHRAPTRQRVRLAATRTGRLTGIVHEVVSQTSPFDDFLEAPGLHTETMYACPNVEITHRLVRANAGTPCFQRFPQFALECAMDELAFKLKLDPIELRLRNYAELDQHEKSPWSSNWLKECYQSGAAAFGWSRRNPLPRATRDGRELVGFGMAAFFYPYAQNPASAKVVVRADGGASVLCGTQETGTGTYTVLAQVAADALGLPLNKVEITAGDTDLPNAPDAGAARIVASITPTVQKAARLIKEKAVRTAINDANSPLYNRRIETIEVAEGRLFVRNRPERGETYAQLLKRNNLPLIEVVAETGGEPEKKKFSTHAFGATFAEVRVDADFGSLRVKRILTVVDAGRVMNRKTARSQIVGGAIWGLGMALLEETEVEPRLASYLNANLGDYHLPVNADAPEIDALFLDEPDWRANPLGVKGGMGEIGVTGVPPAIANAVFNATGKRVRDLPIALTKLL